VIGCWRTHHLQQASGWALAHPTDSVLANSCPRSCIATQLFAIAVRRNENLVGSCARYTQAQRHFPRRAISQFYYVVRFIETACYINRLGARARLTNVFEFMAESFLTARDRAVSSCRYTCYEATRTYSKPDSGRNSRPHQDSPQPSGPTWSWRLLPSREQDHEAHLVATAKSHNRSQMEGHVKALAFMPMFAGVRTQVLRLFREAQKVWRKMNKKDPELEVPSLFYLRKVRIYDEPAVTLLTLLEPLASTTSAPADEVVPRTAPPTS